MINRAIIEIKIKKDDYNKHKYDEIEKIGLEEFYKQIMRQIYNAIEETYEPPHVRVEAVFGDHNDYGVQYYCYDENEKKKYIEEIYMRYYLEFESETDFLGGLDLYDLFDLYLTHVEGDEIDVGWVGHKEADYDKMIEDGVDWTKKK